MIKVRIQPAALRAPVVRRYRAYFEDRSSAFHFSVVGGRDTLRPASLAGFSGVDRILFRFVGMLR